MSATLLDANTEEASFLIKIDARTFENALMEEYKKAPASKKMKSAPVSNQAMLGQYPELEKIASQALGKLMPFYFFSAIKELGLRPISFPNIIPRASKVGEPCVVEVRVTLEPEFQLTQFEGLVASYTPVIVTEDDIARQLDGLRKSYAADNNDSKLLEKMHFASIEALKEDIRSSLTLVAQEKNDFKRKEVVMNKLLEANPIHLKEEIIEQQIMGEINQMRQQMGLQYIESYMKSSGRTLDDLKREVRPQTEARIKKNLLLTAISEKLSPEVTEEDLKEAISKQPLHMDFMTDYEQRLKRIDETPGALDQIKNSIKAEKVTDYIVSKAILHENKPMTIIEAS